MDLTIEKVWDAKAAGYVSADQHVHLNADGAFRVELADALPLMAGEDLDQLSPMSWNRYDRYLDSEILGDRAQTGGGRTAFQSQEVRSNFHGHVGLIGAKTAFYPWFFGPRMPRFDNADRSNGEVMAFAASNDLLATYVHPIRGAEDPFADLARNPIPLELVSDAVLSEEMGIELVCMWTSPLGNSQAWYRLLNIDKPVFATSGTDAFVDFQRTPAMGTARLYTEADQGGDIDRVLAQTRAGQSFLTTGPALLFEIGDAVKPGGVVAPGLREWKVTLASSEPVDVLEIVVNGAVVKQLKGIGAGETREYTGSVELPTGGWVAARAHGGGAGWPGMAVDQFAHASPVWIARRGSIDPKTAAAAAAELLTAINFSESKAREAYGEHLPPKLLARFRAASAVLRELADN